MTGSTTVQLLSGDDRRGEESDVSTLPTTWTDRQTRSRRRSGIRVDRSLSTRTYHHPNSHATGSPQAAETGRRSSPTDVLQHAVLGHRQRHVRVLVNAGDRSRRLRPFTAASLLRRAPASARRISAAGRLAGM